MTDDASTLVQEYNLESGNKIRVFDGCNIKNYTMVWFYKDGKLLASAITDKTQQMTTFSIAQGLSFGKKKYKKCVPEMVNYACNEAKVKFSPKIKFDNKNSRNKTICGLFESALSNIVPAQKSDEDFKKSEVTPDIKCLFSQAQTIEGSCDPYAKLKRRYFKLLYPKF
jgi:hypothetical protein